MSHVHGVGLSAEVRHRSASKPRSENPRVAQLRKAQRDLRRAERNFFAAVEANGVDDIASRRLLNALRGIAGRFRSTAAIVKHSRIVVRRAVCS